MSAGKEGVLRRQSSRALCIGEGLGSIAAIETGLARPKWTARYSFCDLAL